MTGRAAQTEALQGGSLGFPDLAAGVPADEAVTGDEQGDALEEHAVFLGRVAYRQFGDALALPHDRDSGAALRLGLLPGVRAEHELVLFDEEDPGPGVARGLVQRGDDRAQHVVGVAAPFDDLLDGLERATSARHRRPRA